MGIRSKNGVEFEMNFTTNIKNYITMRRFLVNIFKPTIYQRH